MNTTQKLAQLGQSIWYDNIQRGLLDDGTLAGMPAGVAGILTIRFGRSTRRHSARASSRVAAVSSASVGLTSRLT